MTQTPFAQDDEMLLRLADTLHTIFCTKPHADDVLLLLKPRDDEVCYYYLEKTVCDEPGQEKPDLDYWKKEAHLFISFLGAHDAIMALNKLYYILDLIRPVASLSEPEKALFWLLSKSA